MALFSDPKNNLTITEAVEVLQREGFDVSAHKLRQYEKHGLVSPEKSPSQYRLYSDADLNEIRGILYLITLGFSIKAIKHLRSLLTKQGKLIFTIPLGYNKVLDSEILTGKIKFSKVAIFKKLSNKNEWIQINTLFNNIYYNYPLIGTNYLLVLEISEESKSLTLLDSHEMRDYN